MSKKYHCDFCDITIKDNLNMRKNHLDGLKHKILRNDYYEKFKDPREILDEHKNKTTCFRILNNQECKFGSFCRYSHYTAEQLDKLRSKIDEENLQKSLWFEYYKNVPPPNVMATNHNHDHSTAKQYKIKNITWQYPREWLTRLDLPPSLQLCYMKSAGIQHHRSDWGRPPLS